MDACLPQDWPAISVTIQAEQESKELWASLCSLTAQLFLGADPSPFQIRLMGAGHISLLFQMNLKGSPEYPYLFPPVKIRKFWLQDMVYTVLDVLASAQMMCDSLYIHITFTFYF